MALPVPPYIRTARIQDNVIRYRWDDWDLQADESQLEEGFCTRLQHLSQRANLAFSIATAEWIVSRYGLLFDDPLPWQYLESAWAQSVDARYGALTIEGDTNSDEWTGPIRRPIWWGLLQVEFTISEAEEDGNPEVGVGRLITLAEHIMTDPAPYRMWRERIIERLGVLYPLDSEEHLGEVVPREALDPNLDFTLEQTEALLNQFLASLDYRTNPFLNLPEKMLEEGFKGIPYVFEIEQDRKARFEW
jgi:hypothetical protein